MPVSATVVGTNQHCKCHLSKPRLSLSQTLDSPVGDSDHSGRGLPQLLTYQQPGGFRAQQTAPARRSVCIPALQSVLSRPPGHWPCLSRPWPGPDMQASPSVPCHQPCSISQTGCFCSLHLCAHSRGFGPDQKSCLDQKLQWLVTGQKG